MWLCERRDDTGVRMEIAELPATAHPFYFGTQYHPEVRLRSNTRLSLGRLECDMIFLISFFLCVFFVLVVQISAESAVSAVLLLRICRGEENGALHSCRCVRKHSLLSVCIVCMYVMYMCNCFFKIFFFFYLGVFRMGVVV